MPKKSSSPTVWYNSLAKFRSNLNQKPWQKQKYVYAIPTLENLHQEYFSFFATPMPTRMGTPIFPHGEVSFAKFLFCQVDLSNYWRSIFLVLPKLDGCQVSLPNCQRCSEMAWDARSHTEWSSFSSASKPQVHLRP
jgi:hypothetical protein